MGNAARHLFINRFGIRQARFLTPRSQQRWCSVEAEVHEDLRRHYVITRLRHSVSLVEAVPGPSINDL